MQYFKFFLLFIPLTLVLPACTEKKELIDSELYFIDVKQEHNRLLKEAANILDTKLTGNILKDIKHVSYASTITKNAEQILDTNAVAGITTRENIELRHRLFSFEETARLKAIELLKLSVSKTLRFKKDVDTIMLQTDSDQSAAVGRSMELFLAAQYREELTNCCIAPLKHIAIFLGKMDESRHYTLRNTIANVEKSLSSVLRTPEKASVYLNEIESIKTLNSKNVQSGLKH